MSVCRVRGVMAGAVLAAVWGTGIGTHFSQAIVWNGVDFPSRGVTSVNGLTDRPGYFANVLVVNNTYNSSRGTATYLANGWAITARHVVQGSGYGNIAPPTNITFDGVSSSMVIPMPGGVEIALFKLAQTSGSTFATIPSSTIYTGSSETNKLVQQGGYGYWAQIGQTVNTGASFHRSYNISYQSGGFVNTITDGEQRLKDLSLLEGGAMPGDSGSALWMLDAPDSSIADWSQYKLVGVLATSQGNYWGANSSYSRVSSYGTLIRDLVFGSDRTYRWSRGVAGTFTWNNLTPNGEQTNGNNWNSTLTPKFPQGAGDKVTLANAIGASAQVINLNQNVSLGELTIGSTNGTGTQTIAAGVAGSTLTFDNLSATGVLIHYVGGAGDVISAPVVIAGAGTLIISNPSSSALTLSGSITSGKTSGTQVITSDSGSVVMSGAVGDGSLGGKIGLLVSRGTLTLSGINTFTGGVTVGTADSIGSARLIATRSASLPGYDIAGRVTVNSSDDLQVSAGGTGWTSTELNTLITTATFASGSDFLVDVAAGTTVGFTSSITAPLSLTKLGTGTLTHAASSTYTGTTRIEAGTLELTTGKLGTSTADIEVGPLAATGITLKISGGNLTAQRIIIGGNIANNPTGTITATVTQTGGTVNTSQWFTVGSGNGASSQAISAVFNLSGGTLNVRNDSTTTGTSMEIGNFAGTSGTVNLSGTGILNLLNNAPIRIGSNNNAASSTFNQTGGIVSFYSNAGTTLGGTGGLILGAASTLTGTYAYNLSGGILRTPSITRVGGTGVLRFNGGTLSATGSTSSLISSLSSAVVQSGGAIIDTGNFTVTIPQPLVHDTALGATLDGGLKKLGTGTLSITGTNTYTGPTSILAGQLLVPARSSGAGIGRSDLTSVVISPGASLVVAPSASTSDRTVLVTTGLSIATNAMLSLSNNDLLIRNGSESLIRSYVDSWWNDGLKNGTSAAITATSDNLTTLGVISNDNGSGGTRKSTFDGITGLLTTDVLVKYTYLGDTDLSGSVDSTDLSRAVAGIRSGLTGWYNGDTNYDGVVDATDYANVLLGLRYQGIPFDESTLNPTSGTIPEPAALSLLLPALPLLTRRRR